jgi:hypothetical protein
VGRWAIAAGGDFAFPETTGPKPPMVDRINSYVKKAIIAAQYDPVVAKAHMGGSGSSGFTPVPYEASGRGQSPSGRSQRPPGPIHESARRARLDKTQPQVGRACATTNPASGVLASWSSVANPSRTIRLRWD